MEAKKSKLVVSMALFFAVYLLVVALIVRQWGSSNPWSRFDGYVIALLSFSVGMAALQITTSMRLSSSADVTNEFFGLTFDKAMSGWISVLAVLDLLAFADYAHRRLMPSLVNPFLQGAGVVIYALAFLWMWRVDSFLMRNFEAATQQHRLLDSGPFHRLCHPRYSALLLSRIAFVLTIGSIIAWVLILGWLAVIVRRIWLEERHLHALYGSAYDDFARTRTRLIPLLF
jgi:protein-S-isoprenylcysteine O-methyltransferase Ste14